MQSHRCKVIIKYGTPLLLVPQPRLLPASFASTIQLTTCDRSRLKRCSTNTCTLSLKRGAYCLAKHMHVIFNFETMLRVVCSYNFSAQKNIKNSYQR